MRPFGCPVTILNTVDHLGKVDGKVVEGFFIRYSTNSKAFRVFNSRTRIVEENLHVQFIVAENQSNGSTGTKACDNAGEEEKKDAKDLRNEDSEVPSPEEPRVNQEKDASVNSANTINTISLIVNTAGIEDNANDENIVYGCDDDLNMPELEEIVYSNDDEDVGAEADINNLDTHIHIEAMQEELLQFKLQQVWTLVDLPNGKRAIGLQVKQKEDEIFISQDKYLNEILNKFGFSDVKTASTPKRRPIRICLGEKGEDTKIHIDNESTICIVKNPVFHSKTKHIEIRHHFIRDSNEKKLIQMIKIYTDQNVADLLTKAFDVSRFQYLIASFTTVGLLLLMKVTAVRHNLLLPVHVNAVEELERM
ncbi:retrovirus-related pol polyprotein from transposon TNT 1-94, partial [Tanacetum coccineum]